MITINTVYDPIYRSSLNRGPTIRTYGRTHSDHNHVIGPLPRKPDSDQSRDQPRQGRTRPLTGILKVHRTTTVFSKSETNTSGVPHGDAQGPSNLKSWTKQVSMTSPSHTPTTQ